MALHYLIDGYNLLYALTEIPAGSLETKRLTLLNFLQTQQLHGHNDLTIVFDSRQGMGDRERQFGFDIVYTAGESADDRISAMVRKAANPRILVVVTNDRGIQTLVRGTGAKWMSADEFLKGSSNKRSKGAQETAPTSPTENIKDSITDELKKKWL